MGKGNKSRGEKFVSLGHGLVTSEAFRSLSGSSLKIYIELRDRYNGSNNGSLHLSCGAAARLLHLSKSTVSRAFQELAERGIIECTAQGNWYERRASTWALTDRPDNRPNGPALSGRKWRDWKPGKDGK